jgi:hypothetical protein
MEFCLVGFMVQETSAWQSHVDRKMFDWHATFSVVWCLSRNIFFFSLLAEFWC